MNNDRTLLAIGALLLLAVLLVTTGCARHFESKTDLATASHETREETRHETATRSEEPTRIFTLTVKPDGTRKERTVYKGAVEVKRQLEADAKELLAGDTKIETEMEKESKPFGIFAFLSAFWPWLLAAMPVLVVLFRKKLGPLLKLLPFPFSLLAPKE